MPRFKITVDDISRRTYEVDAQHPMTALAKIDHDDYYHDKLEEISNIRVEEVKP
jgi:hypothetical protein